MRHLGDVVFRHVRTHKAHIRARRGYEPTREAAMAAFAKSYLPTTAKQRLARAKDTERLLALLALASVT